MLTGKEMEKIAQHKILATGETFDDCCQHVRRFFDLTTLVIYDCIQIIDQQCQSGLDADFFEVLERAEKKNRASVTGLIGDLRQNWVTEIEDLGRLEQRYPSKVLHLLTHFLDGFIGIDSSFYNLPDDSHWLPAERRTEIESNPAGFWIIHVDGYSATPEEASLLRM